jgi:hypothetical protein
MLSDKLRCIIGDMEAQNMTRQSTWVGISKTVMAP